MIFGKDHDKGLILSGTSLKAVKIGENGITLNDILVHDAHTPNDVIHYLLCRMKLPECPVAMGVIKACEAPVYESSLLAQVKEAKEKSKIKSVNDLLRSGNTFKID
jgi:2-oxoglutarate ferredoxin oxidoreductase subunit beta